MKCIPAIPLCNGTDKSHLSPCCRLLLNSNDHPEPIVSASSDNNRVLIHEMSVIATVTLSL